MLNILQARLQQYVNGELQDVQAGFRKSRETRSNCLHPLDHRKSKEIPEKDLFLLHWLHQSLWLCGSQLTVENSSRDGIPGYLTCLLQNLYAGQEATVKTRYGTTNWHLTYMQSTPCEMPGWMKHNLESRLPGEISTTSDMQMIPP